MTFYGQVIHNYPVVFWLEGRQIGQGITLNSAEVQAWLLMVKVIHWAPMGRSRYASSWRKPSSETGTPCSLMICDWSRPSPAVYRCFNKFFLSR